MQKHWVRQLAFWLALSNLWICFSSKAQVSEQEETISVFRRGVLLPVADNLEVSPTLMIEVTDAYKHLSECIIDFVVIPTKEVKNILDKHNLPMCSKPSCMNAVLEKTGADFVFLPKLEVASGRIQKFGGWLLYDTGQVLEEEVNVSAFTNPASAVAVGLSNVLQIPFGEGIYCNELGNLNQDIEEIILKLNAQKACVPGANLEEGETRKEYPIVGPVILGAAGVALTSLGIVSLTGGGGCSQRDNTGACTQGKKITNEVAAFSYGAAGVGALTGAALWFFLGAEEVPVEVGAVDKEAWGINYKGKF